MVVVVIVEVAGLVGNFGGGIGGITKRGSVVLIGLYQWFVVVVVVVVVVGRSRNVGVLCNIV